MANWIDALKAALGGAGGGAGIGNAVVPGVGAAVGAAGGGILGFLTSLLSGGGKEGGVEQVPIISPEQASVLQFLLQQGHEGLQNPYSGFEPIAQQARENFAQGGIPSIAERFTSGLGGGSQLQGGQRSSAFGQSLGQGAAGLESDLASRQSQHNLGQQGHFKDLLSLGLQPQFAQQLESDAPGLAQTLPGDLLKQLPSILLLLSQLGYFKGTEGAK